MLKKYAEVRDIQARSGFFEHLAKGFTNVKNTTGQHPGGIMAILFVAHDRTQDNLYEASQSHLRIRPFQRIQNAYN